MPNYRYLISFIINRNKHHEFRGGLYTASQNESQEGIKDWLDIKQIREK